jgi:hypothetical protein
MESHGQTRGPMEVPVFAFSYDVVIRLSSGVTSRHSNAKADKKAGKENPSSLPAFFLYTPVTNQCAEAAPAPLG